MNKGNNIDLKALQTIEDIFNHDYSNTTFTSRLYDMFSKNNEAIEAYIQPNREFWQYDPKKGYRKLRVTYVRSGVMFFEYTDEPQTEYAWFISSFNCMMLYAAQIYPYEVGRIIAKYNKGVDLDIPKICQQCKWDDCYGNITVEVVWDNGSATSSTAKEQKQEDMGIIEYMESLGWVFNVYWNNRAIYKLGKDSDSDYMLFEHQGEIGVVHDGMFYYYNLCKLDIGRITTVISTLEKITSNPDCYTVRELLKAHKDINITLDEFAQRKGHRN